MLRITPTQETSTFSIKTGSLPRFGNQTHAGKTDSLLWDGLAVAGNGALFTFGILQLLTPLINKKAEPIAKFLVHQASKVPRFSMSQANLRKLGSFLSNRDSMLYSYRRAIFFGAFFQGINNYQTAINARQPSLITNVMLVDLINILGTLRPKSWIFLCNSAIVPLFSAGKTTDLENNNHPENKRDWDFKRLTRFLPGNQKFADSTSSLSFGQELKDFFRFIGKDFRNSFSLLTWRKLIQDYRKPEAWKSPQPYQSALSTQFNAASFFLTLLGIAAKSPSLGVVAAGTSFLGGLLLRIPMFSRAWQNRRELDGKLVIAGIPLVLAGSIFQPQFTKKLPHMYGLLGLGGPMLVRGLTLNSRKYRKEVELLDSLRRQSVQNPKLTAVAVLQSLRTNQNVLEHLQKQIGVHRVDYFINLLEKAEKAQRLHKIPLASFLAASPDAQNRFA